MQGSPEVEACDPIRCVCQGRLPRMSIHLYLKPSLMPPLKTMSTRATSYQKVCHFPEQTCPVPNFSNEVRYCSETPGELSFAVFRSTPEWSQLHKGQFYMILLYIRNHTPSSLSASLTRMERCAMIQY